MAGNRSQLETNPPLFHVLETHGMCEATFSSWNYLGWGWCLGREVCTEQPHRPPLGRKVAVGGPGPLEQGPVAFRLLLDGCVSPPLAGRPEQPCPPRAPFLGLLSLSFFFHCGKMCLTCKIFHLSHFSVCSSVASGTFTFCAASPSAHLQNFSSSPNCNSPH